MSTFDFVLGIALILTGLLFAAFAERLFSIFDVESRRVQYIRAAGAVFVGVGLVLGASVSNSPDLLRLFGTMAVIGGLAFSLIPNWLWAGMARWLAKEHLTFYRIATVTVTTLLGGFIMWNAFP
jgi:hypothetical protein